MSIKSDRWISEMATTKQMISPFSEKQIKKGISFGLSSYGYDISISDEFKIIDPSLVTELDPKKDNAQFFKTVKADSILIPAGSFILANTIEYFRIPRDILTICFGKSTYARNGVIVNVTPFEPEWDGFATISISNTAGVPVRVYAGEGIAQLLFLEASEICQVSYADKKGKYQSQQSITHSKLK